MTQPTNLLRLTFQFLAPLSSVFLMVFGNAFFTTFLSVFLDSRGYSNNEIGLLHSAYFFGILLGSFQMERIIKRVGHIQALAIFGSLATSAILLQALYPVFPAWVFLRFIVGLSISALYIVIESWLLFYSDFNTRGKVMSLYMICLTTSQAISQQVLGWIDINTFTPFLASALFTSLSVIPVGFSTNRISLPEAAEPIRFLSIIKISPFGVIGCFTTGLLLSTIYSFFPILSVSKDIFSRTLMTTTLAGGVFLQLPIGRLSDYYERRKCFLATILAALLLSILAFILPEMTSINFLILAFFLGGFCFTLYPLSVALVCDRLDASALTTAAAFLLIAFGIGSVTGPIISSTVAEIYGINSLFLYFSILLSLLGGVGIWSFLKRPSIPEEDKSEFIPLFNTTPIAFELDPRIDSHGEEHN